MGAATGALVGVLLVSAGLVAASLYTASGITQLDAGSYHTEFANPVFWYCGFLLALPIGWAAWRYPRFAAGFVIAALVPQFVLPAIVVERYRTSGWGDGLEYLGYLFPMLMTTLFIAVAAGGYFLRREVRKDRQNPL
jgi:hypothetical protein